MADSTQSEVSAMNGSLIGPEHSGGAQVEEVIADTERSLEIEGAGANGFLIDLEHSDMAPEKVVYADTEHSVNHEGEGTNGSLTEGDTDETAFLRGLAAEVVNLEDLERSIAREV